MKKMIYLVFIITSIMVSCSKDTCSPESKVGTYTAGMKIIMKNDKVSQANTYRIENGDNIVFEYQHTYAQCKDVYDDELTKVLTFESDRNATMFRYEGNEIAASKCFFQKSGAWVRHNQYEIKNGLIEGSRISESTWKIKVSVLTTPVFPDEKPEKIEFEQLFEK